jgi:DNA modification methylase
VKKEKIYNLVLLAYLDALGYSKRVKQSSHKQLFKKVLKRYVETVLNFNKKNTSKLGNLKILDNSTATNLKINNGSVDGVITSPPYSFAIDYLKNDKPHLEYFGVNINKLREKMIGLMGRNKKERLENYFIEMDKVCKEISRVLKNGKFLVMIIGSNTKQTGGIKLETSIIASCSKYNLKLKKNIIKPIKGMRNTMKEENILFFRKEI